MKNTSSGLIAWALAVAAATPSALGQVCTPTEAAQFFGPHLEDWQDDSYGTDVAMEDDVAVVGAPETTNVNLIEGATYIYRRVEGVWAFDTKLVPADNKYLDMFGYQVEVADGRLIISKTGWDQDSRGGVYVFALSEKGEWLQEAQIKSPPEEYEFGWSMAASGDSLVVGASDLGEQSAYVYHRRPDGQWLQAARLTAPDTHELNRSVTISGSTLALGGGSVWEHGDGRAYVFVRNDANQWTMVAEIDPPSDEGGPCNDAYVTLSGDTLIVAASYGTEENPYAANRTFVYERSLHGTWDLKAELPAVGAIDQGLILYREAAGQVHVLRHGADGQWVDVAAFTAHDTVPGDGFGHPIRVRGNQAIIAARQHDPDPAVYMFDLPDCQPCPADLNGDGAADLFDFLTFVNFFNALDPVADCNADGEHDLFDFLCFTNAFNAGC